MHNYQCKICKNTINNHPLRVREMMFGTREVFIYFQCSECGCLQISETPHDMAEHYPLDKYYPYHLQVKIGSFRVLLHKLLFGCYKMNLISATFFYLRSFPSYFLSTIKKINKSSAILDIGCGSGHLIREMGKWGWKNLTGLEPYIEKDTTYHNGLKILKQDIFQHSGQYDFIMMNHSLEHMDNHYDILQKCQKLLTPNGLLLIRIPISDSYHFRKYKDNWYAIDAPRHFFLHTKRSISSLAEASGFLIEKIEYDAHIGHFIFSEKYSQNINFHDEYKISAKRRRMLIKQTKILNLLHDSGQACFLLKKK